MTVSSDRADLAAALAAPAPEAGRSLLGCLLVSHRAGVRVAVRIVEVEAYTRDDPASHTFHGPTARNATMFGPPGHLYVYVSHGIHRCANVVCGPDGEGSALLVRGGEVVAGRSVAVQRRGGRDGDDWLAAGPGRLAQALDLRVADDGVALVGEGAGEGVVHLLPGPAPVEDVHRGPRVGVSRAADVPWRFWLAGARGVSRYRRSPRAPDPVRDDASEGRP